MLIVVLFIQANIEFLNANMMLRRCQYAFVILMLVVTHIKLAY